MKTLSFVLVFFLIGLAGGCKPQDPVIPADAGVASDPAPTQGVSDEVDHSTGTELEGMFRYMADAALFRDCRDGKTYPVSMEGQYIDLERAYSNSGIEPGAEIMTNVHGRLLERPSMDNNINEVKLIVDVFNNLLPEKTCTPTTHAELIGTYWKLVELGGDPVTTAEGMREAHVILASEESGVKGFAGCNNFFGQFETADDVLTFSAMGSTMMACPEGMDTEQGFFTALGATTRYRISGLFLELYAEDQLLARLEAIYL